MTVTDNSVSLKEYMTDPDKIYYYQVKAVPVTAEQKKYLKEGEFITSKEQDVDDSEEEEKEKKHAATSQSSSTGPGIAGSLRETTLLCRMGLWQSIPGSWWEVYGITLMLKETVPGAGSRMVENGIILTEMDV